MQKGDLVKVKENANEIQGPCWWAKEMDQYLGGVYRVEDERSDGSIILENVLADTEVNDGDHHWWFNKNWLEPYEENPVSFTEEDILKMLG